MANKRAALLLADGFEEVEAVTPIDLLRRAGIELVTLGVTGNPVTGGHDIIIHADRKIDDFDSEVDAVIVPGGMPGAANIAASDSAVELIEKVFKKNGLVAAICAAPGVVLYPLGILDKRRATCFPGFEKEWTKATFSEERVVIDGNVITSRGAGTAAEFTEAIIAWLLGDKAAADIHSRTLQKD
ncbi:DJ-1 family glyoxalase III [Marispirochaeta sp.]|jgi:protein deglycase|uniref:DJ-1 family glyoxalase III n=1 Tax=Marispirochaeta sp. TaxID=2038653 RepID=UPI0029C8E18D|nr:DJ-1 family glyoxalase III [Marispirochaeta sp.]